jgi:hypothetical protein
MAVLIINVRGHERPLRVPFVGDRNVPRARCFIAFLGRP